MNKSNTPLKTLTSLSVAALACATQAFAQNVVVWDYNFNGLPASTVAANAGVSGGALNASYLNSSGASTTQGSTAGVSGLAGDYAFNNSGGALRSLDASRGVVPASLTSFTWSFWLKPSANMDAGGNRILESSFLYLQFNNELGINGKYNDDPGGPGLPSSFLQSGPAYQATWTFYAITYDSSSASNNLIYYRGTNNPSDPLTTVTQTFTLTGAMNIPATLNLSFANRASNQGAPYNGLLDNMSLIGNAADGSGALDSASVNALRVAAIPEPSTVALLGLIGVSAIVYRIKRRKAGVR